MTVNNVSYNIDKDKLTKCIYTNFCVHCKEIFKPDTIVIAVDQPHHILLHKKCAPYYNFFNGYSWTQPFVFYEYNSNG